MIDQGDEMFTRTQPVLSRLDVVDSLARFREEWQACVDGESLIDVQANRVEVSAGMVKGFFPDLCESNTRVVKPAGEY
jgi:hypothetical protein